MSTPARLRPPLRQARRRHLARRGGHACAARCPRRTKVGHAGTLDPFATGLLLVLVGRATRAQRFLMALPKRYEVVARFGAVSTTGDPEGRSPRPATCPPASWSCPPARLRQRPPAYSAVKVGGRRAYELARAGAEVELAEREIEVYRFEQLWHDGDRRGFVIECSSGTYVRSLIADLGDAYCEELRRTRIGAFDVADADPERPVALSRGAGLPARGRGSTASRRGGPRTAGRVDAPQAAAAEPRARIVRLTDADGLDRAGRARRRRRRRSSRVGAASAD